MIKYPSISDPASIFHITEEDLFTAKLPLDDQLRCKAYSDKIIELEGESKSDVFLPGWVCSQIIIVQNAGIIEPLTALSTIRQRYKEFRNSIEMNIIH